MSAFVLGSLATASRPIVGGTSPKPRHGCGLPVALTTVHSRMVGGTLVSLSMPPPAVSPGGANVRSVLMAVSHVSAGVLHLSSTMPAIVQSDTDAGADH